jgi:hypothetical protein
MSEIDRMFRSAYSDTTVAEKILEKGYSALTLLSEVKLKDCIYTPLILCSAYKNVGHVAP